MVSKENDVLKTHAEQFEKEKINCQSEHAAAIQERERINDEQRQLQDKLAELKEAQR